VNSRFRSDYRLGPILWSIGLGVLGVTLLLFNFDLLAPYEPLAQFILAALFALAGVGFFFAAYAGMPRDWGQLIPAWTLMALAGMILSSTIDTLDARLTAAILFIGLAAAFFHIYLLRRLENWWAVIPGGFMLVLAVVIALSVRIARAETLAAVLFAGMGLVFFVLYLLPARRRQWWSLVPGSVLLVFGLFVLTSSETGTAVWLRWWPVLLILAGIGMGFAAWRRQPAERMTINAAPTAFQPPALPEPTEVAAPSPSTRAALGEYTLPAPGTTVEILPDPDDQE
jgi:hypothetical protein